MVPAQLLYPFLGWLLCLVPIRLKGRTNPVRYSLPRLQPRLRRSRQQFVAKPHDKYLVMLLLVRLI